MEIHNRCKNEVKIIKITADPKSNNLQSQLKMIKWKVNVKLEKPIE